jgi:DNA polymerase-3 subunit epsilon
MNVLFFDTETTGVPRNYKAPMTDLNNWPRVIQLAWQLADLESGELISEKTTLIYPDKWKVPTEKFWIDNGFSQAKSIAEGKPMGAVLDNFVEDYEASEILVAHNIAFDYPILGAEMIRYKKRASKRLNQICTMQNGTAICKIPSPQGRGYKWPKLIELFKHLFTEGFDGAHDAGNDVTACRLAFFEMVKRGHIKL